MTITDFFTQLKALWDQLQNLSPFPSCTCGKCVCNINKRLNDLQARESVMKFLMGLNETFSQVRTQVLLMDPIPSLSKVFSLLIQEETQRAVTIPSIVKVDSIALVAKIPNLGNNFVGNGPSTKGKEKPICTHCGKTGHTADKCYRLMVSPLVSSSRIRQQWLIKFQSLKNWYQTQALVTPSLLRSNVNNS